MREGREFRCPECGTTSPVGVSCSTCKVPMRDENGNPPLKPLPVTPGWIVSPWTAIGAGLIFLGFYAIQLGATGGPGPLTFLLVPFAFFAVGGAFVTLGMTKPRRERSARHARRRALAAARLSAAPPPSPAAKADVAAPVRVRGRVKVLRAVPEPKTGHALAAFDGDDGREGGRWAIVDESGVAVVDDDCFELWARTPDGSPGAALARLADGDTVEVLARATRRLAPDTAGLSPDPHYREAPQALVFEGTPDEPVLVLADRGGAP